MELRKRKVKHLVDQSRKEIKAKDVEHLATTRAMDIRILVAFDRDFIAIPEYMTPRKFIETLGKPPSPPIY